MCDRLVIDRSTNERPTTMSANTVIAASEAKAKFSELLDRVQSGESFSITLHGEEAAKLVPARRASREEIQEVIAQMKAGRSVLNPPGKEKLKIKDLINEGRP
jgi:prevent-host-death family protein